MKKEISGFAIYDKARKVIEYLGEEWRLINPESEFKFYISNKKLNEINLTFLNTENDIYSVSIQDGYGYVYDRTQISMIQSPKSIANIIKNYLINNLEEKYELKFRKIIERNEIIAKENEKLIKNLFYEDIDIGIKNLLCLDLSYFINGFHGSIKEDTFNNKYNVSIEYLDRNKLIKLSKLLKDL